MNVIRMSFYFKNRSILKQFRFVSNNIRAVSQFGSFKNEAIGESWKCAKTYSSIPGPSIINLFWSYSLSGRFKTLNNLDIHKILRKEFGPIYKIQNFGKRDLVVVDNPKDFEMILRTEGTFPLRRGFDSILYYRKKYKKECYPYCESLFIEQGQTWWNLRQKINGILLKSEFINGFIPEIDLMTSEFIENLHNSRNSNLETPENLYHELTKWALEAIIYVAINLRLSLLMGGEQDEDAWKFLNCTQAINSLTFELDFQPSFWKIIKTSKYRKFERIVEDLDKILIRFHKRGLKNYENLKSREESQAYENCVFQKLHKSDKNIAKPLIFDMIVAGVDTTSSAAVAVLYHLAKNKEKQNILRKELMEILPQKDSPLSAENMKNMPYLRACIKEALRLMPVANGIIRATGQDIVLSGYRIPKDTDVFLQSQALYMNNHYFPDAISFIPERWLRLETKHENYNPFTYLPFGFGNRACVGRRFADLELEVLTSRLIRKYHLEWHHPPPRIRSRAFNLPYGNLKMRLVDYT